MINRNHLFKVYANTLLEINGITLIKKWYNPVASWYTIYGKTKKKQMLYYIICDLIPFKLS